MDESIQVGKYTLESLTTGMYLDPKIIFREYIQNSVDALENAVADGILKPEEMRIDIIINAEESSISITDNGTGIPANKAETTLLSIGSSEKRHTNNRGFRGIGRLGGMSYCRRLVFTTSAAGEARKSTVEFDCAKLREMLIPGNNENMNLTDVLAAVTTVSREPETKEKHYFSVELFDVSDFSDLLNVTIIKNYISQVAPLPYQTKVFAYSPDIHRYLADNGYVLEEFPIYLGESSDKLKNVFKLNRNSFSSGRGNKDSIKTIRFFSVEVDGELYALGWYAACEWLGSLLEREYSGLRARKGNILIGDSRTMGQIFKEPRFNGWTQGEIFIVTDKLIPNARRDDFEQNEAYFKFIQNLKDGIGLEISKIIRETSIKRNDGSAKVLNDVEQQIKDAVNIEKEGFNSSLDKKHLEESLKKASETLNKAKVSETQKERKEELQARLEKAKETVSTSKNFKLNQINSGIDKKSKKVISAISDILSARLSKLLADQIIEEIVKVLNGKKG